MVLKKLKGFIKSLHSGSGLKQPKSKRASLVCLELSAWGERSELLSAAAQIMMSAGNRTEALSCALMIAPSLERFRALVEIGIADLRGNHPDRAVGVFKQAIQSLPLRQVDHIRAMHLAKIVVAQARCGDLDIDSARFSLAA